MRLDPRPDAFEMRLRYVCGGLLGLVVGGGLCLSLWPMGVFAAVAVLVGSTVVCAVCAARYGDAFWARLKWWV